METNPSKEPLLHRVYHLLKLSRLEGLHDGIFAIAMTILVLDLRINPTIQVTSLSLDIANVVFPKLFIYMGSFIILGTHWVAMGFQMGLLRSLNRPYLWTHILYLMCICIVPFSASLMAYHPENVDSIWFYAINLIFCSVLQVFIFHTALYYRLNHIKISTDASRAVLKRAALAPLCYFISLFVSFWNTHVAFALLVLPTLIYIFPGNIDKYERTELS